MTITITKVTNELRVFQAASFINSFAGSTNNEIFLALGRGYAWSGNDTIVPGIIQSTNTINQTYRDFVAYKALFVSDASLCVPRIDWANGTTYTAYSDNLDLYTYEASRNSNGTITFSNTAVVGNGTTFLLDFANNSMLQIPGDGVNILPTRFEVMNVQSNTAMTVNIAPTTTITANVPQVISNTFPNYATSFYVRNTFDQVFICLGNNNGIASNTVPQISLGGNFPTSQYIVTADGYLWKYLYTIPSGVKQKFFTQYWMPVILEAQVTGSSVPGRLDVIKINNGGTGYNNGAASLSAPILSIVGDGQNANLTAQTDANGVIVAVNILNAGNNYSQAQIVVAQGSSGNNANLQAVISPPFGWGSNAYVQLGAHTVMFSPFINQSENGTVPTNDAVGGFFKYRQIALVRNPVLANNGTQVANATNYDMTTILSCAANTTMAMNDLAFQSPTGLYANATFTANIVYFDATANKLHLNNLNGVYVPQSQIYATKGANTAPYTSVATFTAITPLIKAFTGQLLYIENRPPVVRATNQQENIKLFVTF